MIFLVLLLFLILEATFISIPFVLLLLLFLSLKNRSTWVFAVAFVSGILLDSLYLRNLGFTSIFFITFLFGVMLYERKFEIANHFFILVSSFIGSFIYFSLLGVEFSIQKALFTCLAAFLLSKIFMNPRKTEAKIW